MAHKKTGFQWVRADQAEEPLARAIRRDRVQEKADNRVLDAITSQLEALSPGQRSRLPLDAELLDEIKVLDRLGTKTARRRQLIRVQGLLRRTDLEQLEAALAGNTEDAARVRALERWRIRLIEGGDTALQAFMDAHPTADRQQLRALARQARGDSPAAVRAARRLFQAMKRMVSPEG